MSYTYIPVEKAPKTFLDKPQQLQNLINQTLHLLHSLGLPLNGLTSRRREKMALAILAIVNVRHAEEWANANDLLTPRGLLTREIIRYLNENFGEDISYGSYDDIRRKDLLLPYLSNLIVTDDPSKDTNDGTRRYALNPEYSALVRGLGAADWDACTARFVADHGTLADRLSRPRILQRTPIFLPSGEVLSFLSGPHNLLQKAIIEDFLPRFGHGAEVLYVGDTANKYSLIKSDKLNQLRFFNLEDAKLPDVVAYSESQNWIYLIEAVHSANPISAERRLVLAELLQHCTASAVYVTAFLDKSVFRKFSPEIAWETEVWIAAEPDHLIHFNGDKFLGPY